MFVPKLGSKTTNQPAINGSHFVSLDIGYFKIKSLTVYNENNDNLIKKQYWCFNGFKCSIIVYWFTNFNELAGELKTWTVI